MSINDANKTDKEMAEHKLTKSRIKLLMQTPFFGQLLCNLDVEEEASVGTMATDDKKIYYNTEFVNSLEQNELNFINVHEIMHVALGHMWRRDTRVQSLWNIACDYAINGLIQENIENSERARRVLKMPTHALYDKRFDGMSAETIYNKLFQNINEDDMNKLLQRLIDNHSKWEDKQSGSGSDDAVSKESLIKEWECKMIQASKTVSSGDLPMGVKRLLDKLTNPTKDWREEIADFCQPEPNDYSFCPPDRRYHDSEFFLPDLNETENVANDILIVMDTSASISRKNLASFYSEVKGAIDQFGDKLNGWVMFFDSQVYEPIRFDSEDEMLAITPKGGGGTSFTKVFEKIKEIYENETLNIGGVLFFTDGYDTFPNPNPIPDVPLLWVITTDEEPPFGRVTRINNN